MKIFSILFASLFFASGALVAQQCGQLTVVTDSLGRTTAVWIANGAIHSNQFNGTSWSTPISISGVSGLVADSLSVGVDQTGDVIAVWQETGSISSSVVSFGDSWSKPSVIFYSKSICDLSLTVDSHSNAIVTWEDAAGVFAANRFYGAPNWSKPIQIGK